MKRIRVVSKKYDRSFRDEYETDLFDENDEIITVFSLAGLRYWDYRKDAWFHAPDGLLEIYFKQKWYNVWHMAEQNSQSALIYVNIAMPAVLRGEILEWVDLDLDYRVNLDNSVERLDEDEFERNSQRLGYPPELIKQIQATCQEVEVGLKRRMFPFDYERQVALYYQIKDSLQLGKGISS